MVTAPTSTCAAAKKNGELCGRTIPDSRTYCSSHHNRWEVIRNHKRNFERANDLAGQELCDMFLTNVRYNPLQPTGGLTNDCISTTQMTFSGFVRDFCNNYLSVLLAMMEAKKDGSEGLKIRDLRSRAKAAAELLLDAPPNQRFRTLRLMDGHGRMTFLILQTILDLNPDFLDTLRVELVDINEEVCEYHRSIFRGDGCRNVTVTRGNILNMAVTPETFVYLNFCGMSESLAGVQQFVSNKTIPFMISYSTSRAAKSKNYKRSLAERARRNGVFDRISERSDFITLKFVPNEDEHNDLGVVNPEINAVAHVPEIDDQQNRQDLFDEWRRTWKGTQKRFCESFGLCPSSFSAWKHDNGPYTKVHNAVVEFLALQQ
jgi:hypothetical protein